MSHGASALDSLITCHLSAATVNAVQLHARGLESERVVRNDSGGEEMADVKADELEF